MNTLGPPRELPLFTYGTLLDPEFTGRLLEHPVEAVGARLLDFELLRVESMPFATVFEAPGEVVEGRIYRGLGPGDWERLDHYEGVHEGLYTRIVVRVVADDGDVSEPAFVYVATEKTLRRYGAS
ncbi:MAG: gamma-glutamylcyclotransferase family protein [Gemmatimonadota bacterium]|nr:gamma-glutamylcyclotransferase family protein [Gemmatimonadota bacterium]